MTTQSNINPNNIVGTYPVAGQDNDSQGFRDNFTNIKTNFDYAATEITELQNKAVLKSALTGQVLDNNMNGALLSNVTFQNTSETRLSLGSKSGSVPINYASSPYQTLATDGSVSLDFSNFTVAGTVSRIRIQINVTNIAHTLTLPAAVVYGITNIQGLSNNVITFNKTGVYEFEFETNDQGGNITIIDLSRNHDPIYLPSAEEINDSSAIKAVSIDNTSTYFNTTDSSELNATLAAGYEGQVKILALESAVANLVVAVSNAAWTTLATESWLSTTSYNINDIVTYNGLTYVSLTSANSNNIPSSSPSDWELRGTITLATQGDACTLMYINSKWFCVGNNGAVFA